MHIMNDSNLQSVFSLLMSINHLMDVFERLWCTQFFLFYGFFGCLINLYKNGGMFNDSLSGYQCT